MSVEVREIPVDEVFAAACAAQRINGGYLKEDAYEFVQGEDGADYRRTAHANKVLMRQLLTDRSHEVTSGDREEAEAVRGYWKLKLFAVLSGNASGYVSRAVECAGFESVRANDLQALGFIASLPIGYANGMVRDRRDEAKQDALMLSEHFGTVGERITGRVRVIDCIYSHNYLCHFVTGSMGNNMVMWSSRNTVEAEREFDLVGKVKRHRDGNVTQLNYVKLK